MTTRPKNSIILRVVITNVSFILLLFFIFGLFSINRRSEAEWLRLNEKAALIASQVSRACSFFFPEADIAEIKKTFNIAMDDSELFGVSMSISNKGAKIYSQTRKAPGVMLDSRIETENEDVVFAEKPIIVNREKIGKVTAYCSAGEIIGGAKKNLESLIWAMFPLSIVFFLSLYLLLWRTVLKPIKLMEQYADRVSSGEKGDPMAGEGLFRGEFESLLSSLKKMVGLLDSRYAQLEKSEQKYRTLFENTPDAIVILDCDLLRLVDVNCNAEKLFGYSRQELLNSNALLDFYAPDQPDGLPVKESAGANLAKAVEGIDSVFERKIINSKNEIRFCEVRLKKLPNAEKKLICISYLDITDRKRIEAENMLDEMRLEALLRLNQMTDLSLREIVDHVLGEAITLTGSTIGYVARLSEDESCLTILSSFNEAVKDRGDEDKPVIYPVEKKGLWSEALRQRKPVIMNDCEAPDPLMARIPTWRFALERHMNVPIFDKQKIVLVAGVGNTGTEYVESDVRQLKLLMSEMWRIIQRKHDEEKLKNSLQEKETLLGELFHRTRNNMQVICSLLELRALDTKDPQNKDALKEMSRRIRTMSLVHQKLYDSRNLSKISLREYAADLAKMISKNYSHLSERINIELDVDDTLILFDIAAPCGLVIFELLSNALKYAFAEGGSGTVRLGIKNDRTDSFCIRVEDDGRGVPEGFDFRQNSQMGLKSVYSIVEHQLQGKVEFEKKRAGVSCVVTFNNNIYKARV